MRCPTCQHENTPAAKFCSQCGTRLEHPCPSCGAVNAAGSNFCDQCGQSLLPLLAPASEARFASPQSYTPPHLAQKILASRHAMERERKLVTVLFSDVSGFTSMAEKLDPEETHLVMERYFDLLLEQVHRYEGTINQFLGDGIMALFGAPIAHEDHAQRAVLAALHIQSAVQAYQRELSQSKGINFRVRTGLNTGLVVVGAISENLRMEYTAVGDTVNVASRMLNLAQPGQVVIAEDTHKLTGGYFVMRPLGEQIVKGKSHPIKAYAVERAREFRTRIDVELERGFSPFVGRERELALLQERFAAARSGRGQVVFEIGEPGVGKSRLLFEFRRSLEGENFSWLTGRCISFGAQIPYLPVIDIVKRFMRIEEGDDEAAVITKCERAVAGLGQELRPAIPYLRNLLSADPGDDGVAKLDAQMRRLKTFEALRGLIWKLAEGAPLVLVVEDLHWMDKASEELLLYLADSCAATRVLFILTHRPGYPNPFGDRTYATRQMLNRLSDQESIRLAEGMLATSDFPSELRGLITRKAEGNPFFVEEVIKSLLETGALRRQNGRYVAAKSLDEIHVPDTIQDVIMGRIDRLEESPKKALQLASVIGREFTVSLLDRISDLREQLGKLLQDLKVLELIYERSLFPELAYMFKHALTQDVTYNSLLLQRRKDLHRLVAGAIEELYAERLAEYYEMLAHHYERGEVWEKALHYRMKAGQKAQQGYANQEALAHFNRALAVGDRLHQAVEPSILMAIYAGKGLALFLMSECLASAEAYQGMLAIAERAQDRAKQAEALHQAGNSFHWGHELEKALECGERAKALAAETGNKEMLAVSIALISNVRAVLGETVTNIARKEEVLKLARETQNTALEAWQLVWLGINHNWQANYELALDLENQALALSKAHHFSGNLLAAPWVLGMTHCSKGDFDQAFSSLREALEWSGRFGDKLYKCRAFNTLGWVYAELYNLDQASQHNEEALADALKVGDPEIIRNAEINLGDCLLLQGEWIRAHSILEKVYRDSQHRGKLGDEWMKWRYLQHCCHSLGELWLIKGDLEKALTLAEECLKLAEPTNSRKNIVKGWRLKGQVFLTRGQLPEAEAAMTKALTLALEIGNPPQLWKTYQ
ncbi:MAG: AAA family ATPase, partial [Verrucomicrobia bacterium]|nr:AAA family ATPase [Verrucomicrobiota bacterium]